jgi:hypothetical protein
MKYYQISGKYLKMDKFKNVEVKMKTQFTFRTFTSIHGNQDLYFLNLHTLENKYRDDLSRCVVKTLFANDPTRE